MHFALSLLNFRPGRIGGTETYLRALIDKLPEQLNGDRLTLVLHPEADAAIPDNGLERLVIKRSNSQLLTMRVLESFTPWRDRTLEKCFRDLGADAVFFPQQSIYPKNIEGPTALTVVDVQHLVLPANIATVDQMFRRAIYPRSLDRADAIVTISQTVTDTLAHYCGVEAAEIDTVLLGFESLNDAPEIVSSSQTKPFLYYPAVSHPHKNHLLLLTTFAEIIRREALPHQLILSGQQTPHWKKVQRHIDELGIGDRVQHLGVVEMAKLRALYAEAEAVLFPTAFEGFGLPVVEAFDAGTRAIVSRIPVFQELGVPEELRVDFSNADALVNAISLPGPFKLEREPVSWTDTASQTLDVLRRIAGGDSRRRQ
jgi:glycosyltransferase involved in cell wall biosynthesis